MKFEDLSPELQEKVKACKTPEELEELVGSEGLELDADVLDAIAGGGIMRNVCALKLRTSSNSSSN